MKIIAWSAALALAASPQDPAREAAAGDAAALAAALDAILTASDSVEYAPARAFRGADGATAARLVRERWPRADERRRPKLCWLLGLNGTAEAADQLRSILRGEEDARVVGNALMALLRCPRSPEDADVARRYAGDERPFTHPFGFYPKTPLGRPLPLRALAEDVLRQLDVSRRATVPGKVVVEPPTLTCLGFEWHIEGDANLNCGVSVRYRKAAAGEWKAGFPFLRVEPGPHPTYAHDPGNLLAGSLFDLEPDTEYEVELSLEDPDGGREKRAVTARTRAEPREAADGRRLHVIPGAGGGTGTEADPFRGIPAADRQARPGDVFLLGPGTYSARDMRLTRSGEPGRPIVWRGASAEAVVLDAGESESALSASRLKHVHLEELSLVNGKHALEAFGTEALVLRRCRIAGYRYVGVYGGFGRGTASRDWLVSDNLFSGPADWSKGRKESSYGIVLGGPGHVIRHNRIENHWDGISLAGGGEKGGAEPRTVSVDVYGNDIRQATDDGVECDYTWHNIRVFRNRLVNTFCSLSFQPIYGGPGYFLRNAMHNTTNKPFKLHVDPSGVVAAHNTCASSVEAFHGGGFHRAYFRNNLMLGQTGERGGYWMNVQARGLDLDYTGWNRPSAEAFVRLNAVRYGDPAAFAEGTGLGSHNVLVDWDVFAVAPRPPGPLRAADPDAADLRLRPGSAAVDAGVPLPGLNDGFSGKAPDLGCAELGSPELRYGPRPR